jgi:hypothetical protein
VTAGFTVIVNVAGDPVQVAPPLVKEGVTVIVAVMGDELVFTAVKEGISPVPLAAKPIEVTLFVQLNTVPVTAPEKVTVVVDELLHTI